ncbi:hypothetical protein F1D05_28505 [Kribbella qitaiheensis]|uniref:Uncharacterized protein n=1 Tax=Kribbella qitaiheensis TaxID=1544730 RepID=A0A7G6X4G9_9ACTN|nr:hypothetical protein [Kribbella qitaiheensis]QNE21134.1 hypothetical protein F1D05_28505 [Kribbella qitaiheensis]
MDSDVFVGGVPWTVWRMVAAAAVVLFLAVIVTAVRVLVEVDRWGIVASKSTRWTYLAFATAGAGALIVGRLVASGNNPDLPVKNLELRTGAVLLTGLIATIPWLVLVWLAHETCHLLQRRIELLPPIPTRTEESAAASLVGGAELHREVISRLLRLWDLLVLCVGVFALGVVAAIVTSSTLRAAFIDVHPDRERDFPAVNVLYYGALFAVIASVLSVPLVAAWRRCAQHVVDRAYPLPADGQPTEAWVAARARLEVLLHLNVSLLRNPLTGLAVLSPLLTSALAAFIPQLAKS